MAILLIKYWADFLCVCARVCVCVCSISDAMHSQCLDEIEEELEIVFFLTKSLSGRSGGISTK